MVVEFSAWEQKSSNFSPEREKHGTGGSSRVITAEFHLRNVGTHHPCVAEGSSHWESRAVPVLHLL